MRIINNCELHFCKILYSAIPMSMDVSSNQFVWVVNQEMGSIRADYCTIYSPVHAVSTCETKDIDETPVVITLLLTKKNKFGELDFWKVNDEPIKNFSYLMENVEGSKNR